MKLLLDTHIWIWQIERPEKLSLVVRRELDDPKNECYLSAISIWEAHLLAQRNRLRIKGSFSEWLDQVFLRTPLLEAPINRAVAAQACQLQLPQSDLGDLFLAATALTFGLTLVTADSQLIRCRWLKTLANG